MVARTSGGVLPFDGSKTVASAQHLAMPLGCKKIPANPGYCFFRK